MKTHCEVAIIGAGPYGLSLAAHLGARGVDYRIFGKPLDTWVSHMPRNMTLRSEGFASNLSAPSPDSTIKSWFAQKSLPYTDQGHPISLNNFLGYADFFRRRYVPNVEEIQVMSLERCPGGFSLTFDDGNCVFARQVVLAVGTTWFAHTPEFLSHLPADLASHSSVHREADRFRNKEVAIIGAGSSAVDIAHLLKDAGASPHIVARTEALSYSSAPNPHCRSFFNKLQNPCSTLGHGWRSYFCAEAPLLFYRMPQHLKKRAIASHLRAAAPWFMRNRIEGRIPMMLGRSVAKAEAKNKRVELTMVMRDGAEQSLTCDHVIAATGYRVDIARIPFLAPSLRADIALTAAGSPFVFDNFETSTDGLYMIGLAVMEMFGPLLRFVAGTEFAAPRLAAHLERKVMRATCRTAA